jgi:hypothetical protein
MNRKGIFSKEDQRIVDNGGTVVREWDIKGEHHRMEFTKQRMVEFIDGEARILIGKLDK